jgi:hypothetical protein
LTLEEKINHLRTTSMEEARAESNAIIDSYRDALEKVFEDHKIEAKRQMQTRIKAEKPGNGARPAGFKTPPGPHSAGTKRQDL